MVTRGMHEPRSLHQRPLCGLAMGSVPRYLLTTPPKRPPWPAGQQALGPFHETQSLSRAHTCQDKHSEHPDAHCPPSMGTCGRLAAPHPGGLVIYRAPNHSQVTSRTQPSMAMLPSPKATKAEGRSHYHLGMPAAQPHHRGSRLGIKPPILELDPPLHRTGKEQRGPGRKWTQDHEQRVAHATSPQDAAWRGLTAPGRLSSLRPADIH